jgi:type III secretory pathway component EscV
VVIEGATGAAVTLRVPALLVALPALLVTTTVNDARLSEDVVARVAYDEEVAPLIAAAFFCHW